MASADVKFPIRLEGLACEHEDYCSVRICVASRDCRSQSDWSQYEPELFPGLIYRMVSPKIVLLVFVSGKIVMTGVKVCRWFADTVT
mgnify:CR=1 FL=1